MGQFNEFSDSNPFSSPSPPPPLPTTRQPENAPKILALPPLAIYPSKDILFEAIQSWAKLRGYDFVTGKIKKLPSRFQTVYYACNRNPLAPPARKDRLRDTQTRGTAGLFSILAVESSLGWVVKYRLEPKFNINNHPPDQSPGASFTPTLLDSSSEYSQTGIFSWCTAPKHAGYYAAHSPRDASYT
jgi:hypothetical protein